MRITWAKGTAARPARVTIELAPSDDPAGRIAEMLADGELEAFLRAYGRDTDLGAPANAADALDVLTKFGHVHNRSIGRLKGLMLAARDQWGYGWGTIAQAVGMPRTTVKERIQTARQNYAAMGQWYDADGYHHASTDTAQNAIRPACERDGRGTYYDGSGNDRFFSDIPQDDYRPHEPEPTDQF